MANGSISKTAGLEVLKKATNRAAKWSPRGAQHIVRRRTKKHQIKCKELSRCHSNLTTTDSSTHLQNCLHRLVDQVATLTSNYCCNFSQAEAVEVPIPTSCFHSIGLFLPSSGSQIDRKISSFMFALSCSTCCIIGRFSFALGPFLLTSEHFHQLVSWQ